MELNGEWMYLGVDSFATVSALVVNLGINAGEETETVL